MISRVWPSIKNNPSLLGFALVLMVAAIAASLTMQGWRSRIPAFDLVPHIRNTLDLLATGAIPVHGDTGSYGSYKPPGTAWLMLPGAIFLVDPRLSEYVATALLHLATLLGLFLLARAYFGVWCASLSVLLYGLSEHGLFLAGSLWPNGRPDFYIWIVYLSSRWVRYDDARYLAAASTLWAAGMFVDMGIAPAIFILPALWLYYRPAVRVRPLLVGGALVLVLWSPYLQFEAARGFADLRSQLLLRNIFPGNYRDSWCDPNLALASWEQGPAQPILVSTVLPDGQNPLPGPLRGLLTRGDQFKEKILSNFGQAAPIPGAGIALTLLTLGSLTVLSLSRGHAGATSAFRRILARTGVAIQSAGQAKQTRLLVLSLGVPWSILVLAAEPGKPERFWWIWPLQVLFLAAFVTRVLPGWKAARPLVWASQAALIFVLIGNSFLLTRADSWLQTGWGGRDAETVQVVDYVAGQVRAEGRDRAAIGYHTLIYPFMAQYNITNPQYKVGAEFDLLFEAKAGVSNNSVCAEGISPDDEYRIVQVKPQAEEWAPRQYFDVPLDGGFYLLRRFDSYQVFKRDEVVRLGVMP